MIYDVLTKIKEHKKAIRQVKKIQKKVLRKIDDMYCADCLHTETERLIKLYKKYIKDFEEEYEKYGNYKN